MSTNAATKAMTLRREVRDLEQKAEELEERAKHALTTEDASARFSLEAQAIRNLILAQKARIEVLESSLQTRLFN